MNKIAVLGLIKERSEILKSLMELGVVEITQEQPGEELVDKAYNPVVQSDLAKIDSKLAGLSRSIEISGHYVPVKKPMFSARRIISETDYSSVLLKTDKILECSGQINGCEDELNKLKSDENRVNGLLSALNPWLELDIPLDVTETRHTFCYTGSISGRTELDPFKEELGKQFPEVALLVGTSDREHHYIAVIGHKSVETEVMSFLRNYGWNRITLRETIGTAGESKALLGKKLEAIRLEQQKKIDNIKVLAGERENLEVLSDSFRMERSRLEAKSRMVSTRSAFMLKGWLPAELSVKVKDYLDKNYFCSVEITPPADDEEFPVLVQNGPVVESISPVLTMYGVPNCRETDPSIAMLPFYAMSFGLMLGDGGYGLLIAIFTGIVLKKFRLEESTKRFMKLLFICGLSTIFAGFLFGSWFGISSLSKTAWLIVPTENPELMLSYSILFGIAHMYVGFFIKALNMIRRGHVLDAIIDVGITYVMYSGFIMSLLPYAPGISVAGTSPIVKTGNYLFVVGVVLMLATSGRHSKKILGKIFGGLPRLYDIISFFSDCLSYTRILALGLASAIIADILNTMSMTFTSIIVKVLLGGVILLFGHTMNFAINALGAYVHSCRLQFLEFFGKFFEGGGTAFSPLVANTKYIVVQTRTSQFLQSGTKAGVA